MTTMDITFRIAANLSDAQIQALARLPGVYGIRKLHIDEAARSLTLEYDATRLDAARVEALVRACGVVPLPEPVNA